MRTIVTTLVLAIVGVAVCLAWARLQSLRWKQAGRAKQQAKTIRRTTLAYSFQSGLSFADAVKMLGADKDRAKQSGVTAFGDWYERDSAWHAKLLSCRSHRGMSMNLYFFEDRNVLELKIAESEAARSAAVAFARHELLSALGARDVQPADSVN